MTNQADNALDQDIIKADPRYRRKLFSIYLLALIAGAAFIYFGIPRIRIWFFSHNIFTALEIAKWGAVSFLMVFMVPAIVLIRIGKKALLLDAYPYPGMKMLRDTRIIRGRGARIRAKALIILGAFSIFFSMAGSAATFYAFAHYRSTIEHFFGPSPKATPVSPVPIVQASDFAAAQGSCQWYTIILCQYYNATAI